MTDPDLDFRVLRETVDYHKQSLSLAHENLRNHEVKLTMIEQVQGRHTQRLDKLDDAMAHQQLLLMEINSQGRQIMGDQARLASLLTDMRSTTVRMDDSLTRHIRQETVDFEKMSRLIIRLSVLLVIFVLMIHGAKMFSSADGESVLSLIPSILGIGG